MPNKRSAAEAVAEHYYDSGDADRFYEKIWGGEDIHIGLYEPGDSIYQASRRTVAAMLRQLEGLHRQARVIDLGAGYGGAARYLASQAGCHVTCLNLSKVQNARNRRLNRAQQLDDRIAVLHGSFEAIPAEAASMDIVWSQDAFLHSSHREQVLSEICRVLKPGGELIFTDPMQSEACPPEALRAVCERLSLESLATVGFYRTQLGSLGFSELAVQEQSGQLRNHYAAVRENLRTNYRHLATEISLGYMDRMLQGLQNWVDAADAGYLAWGILHFRKDPG
jgi:sarcosine/dimethylglycine N-methyltransferase